MQYYRMKKGAKEEARRAMVAIAVMKVQILRWRLVRVIYCNITHPVCDPII